MWDLTDIVHVYWYHMIQNYVMDGNHVICILLYDTILINTLPKNTILYLWYYMILCHI